MSSRKLAIEFIGSATSGFQADPICRNSQGHIVATSDWEWELKKNLEGIRSGIKTWQPERSMPRFFEKIPAYLDRSVALGENMFRFSLEMGRLCPAPGEWNDAYMEENVKVLAHIRARGQEPMLTINHFTMPLFLTRTNNKGAIVAGAWEHPDVLDHFRFYLDHVAEFLGNADKVRHVLESENFDKKLQDKLLAEGLVKYFMSINEPATVIGNGYLRGAFPPFRKARLDLAMKVLDKMAEVHEMTRFTLKDLGIRMKLPSKRTPQIGGGYNWNYLDGPLENLLHTWIDRKITDKFERDGLCSDFLALQYYFRTTLPFSKRKGRDFGDHPAFGDIYPQGILEVLKKMHKAYLYPEKPIFITEIGFSDAADLRRPFWLLRTMQFVLEAKQIGIPVKGVLLWSLVDNLEWEQGMGQKFGLFDERELDEPLVPSVPSDPNGERIRSWEVWAACINKIRHPSRESENAFWSCHERARVQYQRAIEE